MKESELFVYLKDYFGVNPKNEIFTEVVGLEGGRPDIVIRTNKNIITIVEMKTTLSMELLEQVINWRYRANYIYIAIPESKNKRINKFALRILKDYGIGILVVTLPKDSEFKYIESGEVEYREYVSEEMKPKLFRNHNLKWKEVLKEIYRCENNVNGCNQGGGYNTPYKAMIKDVKRYIYRKKNNSVSIKELIENLSSIKAHYSNPKASLYNALTTIENDDFESELIGRQMYFKLSKTAYESFNVYEW